MPPMAASAVRHRSTAVQRRIRPQPFTSHALLLLRCPPSAVRLPGVLLLLVPLNGQRTLRRPLRRRPLCRRRRGKRRRCAGQRSAPTAHNEAPVEPRSGPVATPTVICNVPLGMRPTIVHHSSPSAFSSALRIGQSDVRRPHRTDRAPFSRLAQRRHSTAPRTFSPDAAAFDAAGRIPSPAAADIPEQRPRVRRTRPDDRAPMPAFGRHASNHTLNKSEYAFKEPLNSPKDTQLARKQPPDFGAEQAATPEHPLPAHPTDHRRPPACDSVRSPLPPAATAGRPPDDRIDALLARVRAEPQRLRHAPAHVRRSLRLAGGGELAQNTGTGGPDRSAGLLASAAGPANAVISGWGSPPAATATGAGAISGWGTAPQAPAATGGWGTATAANNGCLPARADRPTNKPVSTSSASSTSSSTGGWAAAAAGGPVFGKSGPNNNGSSSSSTSSNLAMQSNITNNNAGTAAQQQHAAAVAAAASTAAGLLVGSPAAAATKNQLEQLNTMREALFSQDGWGCQHVNQDSNWDVPGTPEPGATAGQTAASTAGTTGTTAGASVGPKLDRLDAATSTGNANATAGRDGRETGAAAVVWKPNVNNGTDLWEANLRGDKMQPPTPVIKALWGPPSTNLGGTWGEDDDNGPDGPNVWSGSTGVPGSGPMSAGAVQQQSAAAAAAAAAQQQQAVQQQQHMQAVAAAAAAAAVAAAAVQQQHQQQQHPPTQWGSSGSGSGGAQPSGGAPMWPSVGPTAGGPPKPKLDEWGGSGGGSTAGAPTGGAATWSEQHVPQRAPPATVQQQPANYGPSGGVASSASNNNGAANADMRGDPRGISGRLNGTTELWGQPASGSGGPSTPVSSGNGSNNNNPNNAPASANATSAKNAPGGQWGQSTGPPSGKDKQSTGWEEPSPPAQRRNIPNYDDGTAVWGQQQQQQQPPPQQAPQQLPGGVPGWKDMIDLNRMRQAGPQQRGPLKSDAGMWGGGGGGGSGAGGHGGRTNSWDDAHTSQWDEQNKATPPSWGDLQQQQQQQQQQQKSGPWPGKNKPMHQWGGGGAGDNNLGDDWGPLGNRMKHQSGQQQQQQPPIYQVNMPPGGKPTDPWKNCDIMNNIRVSNKYHDCMALGYKMYEIDMMVFANNYNIDDTYEMLKRAPRPLLPNADCNMGVFMPGGLGGDPQQQPQPFGPDGLGGHGGGGTHGGAGYMRGYPDGGPQQPMTFEQNPQLANLGTLGGIPMQNAKNFGANGPHVGSLAGVLGGGGAGSAGGAGTLGGLPGGMVGSLAAAAAGLGQMGAGGGAAGGGLNALSALGGLSALGAGGICALGAGGLGPMSGLIGGVAGTLGGLGVAAAAAMGGNPAQPSTQQLRVLVQQIQMAVQAGYLNHQILNQPLAPTTLILLNQLLTNIKQLQMTNQQQNLNRAGGGGPGGPGNGPGCALQMNVSKLKQQIASLQNQIAAQQAIYVKQQQQQQAAVAAAAAAGAQAAAAQAQAAQAAAAQAVAQHQHQQQQHHQHQHQQQHHHQQSGGSAGGSQQPSGLLSIGQPTQHGHLAGEYMRGNPPQQQHDPIAAALQPFGDMSLGKMQEAQAQAAAFAAAASAGGSSVSAGGGPGGPASTQQQSRLNQWKLPSLDKSDGDGSAPSASSANSAGATAASVSAASNTGGTDFSRAPGTTAKSTLSTASASMSALGLGQIEGTWSASGRSNDGGWPDASDADAKPDWSNSGQRPATSAAASSAAAAEAAAAAAAAAAFTDLVPEFEPGKPWKGSQIKTIEDDPSITPGSVARSPLSISAAAAAKESDLFASSGVSTGNSNAPTASGSGGKVSPVELPPLSLNSSTWTFNPGPTQPNFAGVKPTTNTWSSDQQPIVAPSSSELWGAPMSKPPTRGPPPGLGNQPQKPPGGGGQLNGWMSRGGGGGGIAGGINIGGPSPWAGGAGTSAQSMTWSSTWLLLKNLTSRIDGPTLRTLCMQHGPLQHFHVYPSHGIALCKYISREEAAKAQMALNQCVLGQTTIVAESPGDMEVQSILRHLGVSAAGGASGGNMSAHQQQQQQQPMQGPPGVAANPWRTPPGGPSMVTRGGGNDAWATSGSQANNWTGGPDGSRSMWTPIESGGGERGTPSSLNSYLPENLLGTELN